MSNGPGLCGTEAAKRYRCRDGKRRTFRSFLPRVTRALLRFDRRDAAARVEVAGGLRSACSRRMAAY
jgi:hypothetical protein